MGLIEGNGLPVVLQRFGVTSEVLKRHSAHMIRVAEIGT
jgi:hypothetical protein